jgi:hypothetical protein
LDRKFYEDIKKGGRRERNQREKKVLGIRRKESSLVSTLDPHHRYMNIQEEVRLIAVWE